MSKTRPGMPVKIQLLWAPTLSRKRQRSSLLLRPVKRPVNPRPRTRLNFGFLTSLMSEWPPQFQPWKAGKPSIGADELAIVFNGQRSEIGVGDIVAAGAGILA